MILLGNIHYYYRNLNDRPVMKRSLSSRFKINHKFKPLSQIPIVEDRKPNL